MPSTSLDPLSLGAHDKRPKATCELVAGDDVDSNLLKKRQSQYEASDEESKKKECEKETSPSDPAAALKSDIFHRFSFLLTPLFALCPLSSLIDIEPLIRFLSFQFPYMGVQTLSLVT